MQVSVPNSSSITLLKKLPSTLYQSMGTENNIDDLRVASFSYYLKPIEDVVNMFDAGENFDISVLDLQRVKPSIFTGRKLHQKSSSGKKWPFYGCTGPCYIKQSIKKVNQFTFPVMINHSTMEILSNKEEKIQGPRMSIDVFGSGRAILTKMSIWSWDAIPKSKDSSVFCDDIASEASSDLFEIENVSRTGWQPSKSTR